MINFKWLSIYDVKPFYKLTENMPEKDFDMAVYDAYLFEVLPTLPDDMLDAIRNVLEVNPEQWNEGESYLIGEKVFYDGAYYICTVDNTVSAPPSSGWEKIELMSFWIDFVKPYFISLAYHKFLLWHGTNITQFGARQNNEDTSNEITDKRRGELLQDVSNKAQVYLSRLTKEFRRVGGKFDEVVYSMDCGDNNNTNGGFRIWKV